MTAAEVRNKLKDYFRPELFTPLDIKVERKKLKELLQDCK